MIKSEDVRRYLAEYGESMRKKRKAKNLTQDNVAAECHISQAIISHIECGCFMPNKSLEKKLLEFY